MAVVSALLGAMVVAADVLVVAQIGRLLDGDGSGYICSVAEGWKRQKGTFGRESGVIRTFVKRALRHSATAPFAVLECHTLCETLSRVIDENDDRCNRAVPIPKRFVHMILCGGFVSNRRQLGSSPSA